jgi:ABC-type multidrug transport system fused ATPase/permease subunit
MVYKNSNPIITMIKTEWQYLGKEKTKFIIYMIFFLIAGITALISPWIIGQIFNSIQTGNITTNPELKKLFIMISLLFVIKLVFWTFHGTGRIMEQLTGFQAHKNYANEKIRKTTELPVEWHKDNHSGDTIDRINKARLSLFSYVQHDSFQLLYILIDIFGSLSIIFFIDIKIGASALLFCSIIFYSSMKIDKKIKQIHKRVNEFDHKLSASIFDYFSNIITVITLRLKKVVRIKLEEKIVASEKDHKESTYLIELKWAVASLLITAMTVVILIYQAYTDFNTTGIILIGTLFMLFSYLDRVGNSFFKFAQFYGAMTKKAADIESADSIEEAFEKISEELKSTLPKSWKQIDIKNICFTYNTNGKTQHICNTNLSFKHGQRIALIGESGSGKSTILSLLRGLYLPQSANITCDGKKLKHGIQTLKQSITLIPQDPEIFNETIRYNITMDMFQNEKDLQKAIKMAQFKSVVDRLEKGVDTNVQEKGVSLSGGEKQRLALARGILAARDSDIILLDEPTSSVDSNNEKKIHENIFKEFSDKTIISSIHRLHLLDKFDYIYMFDQGKIIGKGTFEEIKQNPNFLKIWQKYIGSIKE